jgi:broad specificity phosphatase PhoE
MITRLFLLAHAPTAAQRALHFPADGDEPEALGDSVQQGLRRAVGACAAVWCGPERRSVATAEALGLAGVPAAGLRAWSMGRWAGRDVQEVAVQEPAAFAAWRTDPAAAPPGGESLDQLLERTGSWLARETAVNGRALAVADQAVIRAVVVRALRAGAHVFWSLDVAPLSLSVLQQAEGRWMLRGLNIRAADLAA